MFEPGSDWFGQWLEAQLALQREAFDVEPQDAGMDYLIYNLLGATAEWGEVMQEIDWRPWSKSQGSIAPGVVEEIVDVLHFIANVILWAGIDSKELTDVYRQKILVNIARQRDGYKNTEKK